MTKAQIPELEDEYNYLQWCINERYWSRSQQLRIPVRDEISEAVRVADWDKAKELEEHDSAIACLLSEERCRSEDIVRWLKLDAQLRLEGTTYAEVYERSQSATTEIAIAF